MGQRQKQADQERARYNREVVRAHEDKVRKDLQQHQSRVKQLNADGYEERVVRENSKAGDGAHSATAERANVTKGSIRAVRNGSVWRYGLEDTVRVDMARLSCNSHFLSCVSRKAHCAAWNGARCVMGLR